MKKSEGKGDEKEDTIGERNRLMLMQSKKRKSIIKTHVANCELSCPSAALKAAARSAVIFCVW